MSNRVQKYGEKILQSTRNLISYRYHAITKAINKEFWELSSETMHSIYVGSYGRNTAINTSDIDILVEIPSNFFDRFNSLSGNSQSRMLQVVKNVIISSYPRSNIHADGQVIKIDFSDGMNFEIVPAFKNINGSYQYPDSNMGGNWKSTNPKAEQKAMAEKNKSSNGLLYDTCRHIRFIRDNYFSSYHLSGIVIDSFVYNAIGNWRWLNNGEASSQPSGTYEKILLDYYNNCSIKYGLNINAPGSYDIVSTNTSYECLEKVLKKII